MATIKPFAALRPTPQRVAQVAAVPYDVVNVDEARQLARDNPFSFLHVSRAEIDLEALLDPYAPKVYHQAAANFEQMKRAAPLVVEDRPSLYVYRLRRDEHEQVGLVGCFSLAEYDRDIIKKHERTRRDKEDDRTKHMLALSAQTGPVFLTYRARDALDELIRRSINGQPLFDFMAPDGVGHTVWQLSAADVPAAVREFEAVPAVYIADGHHRAASAARARSELRLQQEAAERGDGDLECDTMLGVAFPHDQVQILPYNRIVKDLAGLAPEQFLAAVDAYFRIEPGGATPPQRGHVAMFIADRWHMLTPRQAPGEQGTDTAVRRLDVSMLQDMLLEPVLNIRDVRTDKRIDFVGGDRGTTELERLVRGGKAAAVAFSMYPVAVDDLMNIADEGAIMPPKSTWFEPKLRDGLLSHLI